MSKIREKGREVLETVLKHKQNIDLVEKYVFTISKDEEEYAKYLYEICNSLKSGKTIKDIMIEFKKGIIGWNSSSFYDFKKIQEEKDNFITKPFDVEEGVNTCNKCGSKKTYSYTKQVRSSDEGTTVFCICVMCKNKWRFG